MKKVLSIMLVIIWGCLICGFSSDCGEKSSNITREVIVSTSSLFTNVDKNSKDMERIVEKTSFPLRKCAHFFMYFALSFLIMNALYINGVKKNTLIITSIICILFAITDETHQLFVNGRSGKVVDVFLDSSASLICAFLYHRLIILRSYHEKVK